MIEIKPRDPNKKAEFYRKEGYIPGIIYGPEIESYPVFIEKKVFEKNLKHTHQRFMFVFNNKRLMGILQEIQKHPITLEPIHFDIYVPSLSQEIVTTIPIHFSGEEAITKEGYILNKSLVELEVEGKIMDLPEFVEVDVSNLEPGESIYVKDLKLKESIRVLVSPETPIATVILPEELQEESE
jgi:large subunit ribosomal protein L25